MRFTFLGIAAVVLGGLILTHDAQATEMMLLAGVGSLSGTRDITAPTINLKRDATTEADTIDVNGPIARGIGGVARVGGRAVVGVGRIGVGSVRFASGYPFYRPWVGYRPWGWYRPWLGYYRPWGWYRPWFYPGLAVNFGIGGYPDVAAYPSAYYSGAAYGFPAICGCTGYATPAAAVETAPPPRPNDGYHYDGGPANPAPAPRSITPQTPPAPPAAVGAVARRPTKKLEYPAYGEAPAKAHAIDPLLVKNAPAN